MKVTIITVNYNHLKGLIRTMNSVQSQSFCDMEYIIIDGGSTDGSKEYIESHSSRVAYWVSEPDYGVYDAMNKGISVASGKYLLFLNSGDVLVSNNVLEKVFEKEIHEVDLIVGRQYQIRGGHRHTCHCIFPNEINERFLISNTLPHQATFIKKDLFSKTKGYNQKYKIVADWVFWNEAIVKYHASVDCIDVFVAEMEEEGLSGDIKSCREEMARYLMDKHRILTLEDWLFMIRENSESYRIRRVERSKLGRLLVRMMLKLHK